MINKAFLIALIGLLFTLRVDAQNDEKYPIFDCGDETVYSDEFLRVFNKNKRDDNPPTQEEIEEYLLLYTKFKLKVSEAYSRRMDTIPSFINELAGYRTQLAKPYLTDKSVNARLVQEAYDRSTMEVRASHFLIECALDAKPTDSLIAYNKIMGYRTRVLEKGEDFNKLAQEFSEDRSARTNGGDLGYFTAFQMIYPFENAAFNGEVGEVSMPIRTQFGYHLVYVKDKRKSLGDIQVSHIMIKFNNQSEVDSAKRRIDGVYKMVKIGGNWETLVEEFSEDFNTNAKGGLLNWFNRTTSNIPVEFKDEAYNLKNKGDYSEPIKTQFGWHIIRLEDTKPLPTFKEMEMSLKRKVEKDSRSSLNKEVVVKRIKEENKFIEKAGFAGIANTLDESVLQGGFKTPKLTSEKTLFTINGRSYTDKIFYAYVATNQGRTNASLATVERDMYKNFVSQMNLDYEESILESKYPQFKYIMQEYKDGILLFELTDKEVWSKAIDDSAGLAQFYEANAAYYVWNERADATIFSCNNAKTAKKAKKCASKGEPVADIINSLNAKDALAIKTQSKKFEKGNNSLLDGITWQKGVYDLQPENDRFKFVVINEIIPPGPKPLIENMGQATSDYQNYLEKQWLEVLKKKYPITIYRKNVAKLYQ